MADGHFTDVELLRRELASLILEWAGKAVKDDPDGPMSTALTRAVGDAARDAVAAQHQTLTADTAEQIAEALDRRGRSTAFSARPWVLVLFGLAAAALLGVTFLLGLQVGRSEAALAPAPAPAATGVNAPIAPLAPTVDELAPSHAKPRAEATEPPARPLRATPPPTKPAPRPTPRDVGRPAATNDAPTSNAAQPVGAAPPPTTATTVPKP